MKSKDNSWFWDTEILVRGQKLGYKIKEIPVKWRESDSYYGQYFQRYQGDGMSTLAVVVGFKRK